MDDGRAWRPFPASHPDVPVLLVATSFGPASYAVYVTDLANVWAERLERRDICMRAFQENTTIDPSYDNEQMAVFLGKLQAALDASQPGHADASLSLATALSSSKSTSVDGGDLVLHTTSVLPQGLQPLKWPLRLKKQSPVAIASGLVLPLIQGRAVHQRASAGLVAALRDKDAVINKLVDKLEAMGAGVESAFPSLTAGRRGKMARADVERRVRGLAPFDDAAFRKQVQTEGSVDDDEETPNITKLVESAFGGDHELRCDVESAAAVAASISPHKLDAWWQELGTGPGVPLKRVQPKTTTTSQQTAGSNAPLGDETGQEADDLFQTTPSRPASTRKLNAKQAEDERQDPPSPTPAKEKAAPAKIGRLGAIGKKPKTASPPPAKEEKEEEEDETASEADEEPPEAKASKTKNVQATDDKEEDEAPAPTVTTASLRTKPARGGLGRIGGKKEKEPVPEPEPEPEPAGEVEMAPPPAETTAPASPKPTRAGLGRIGKGKGAATTAVAVKKETDNSTDEDAGKRKAAQAEAKAALPPKEDERKRAEMLQQAVEKHAAPARKKRKF